MARVRLISPSKTTIVFTRERGLGVKRAVFSRIMVTRMATELTESL